MLKKCVWFNLLQLYKFCTSWDNLQRCPGQNCFVQVKKWTKSIKQMKMCFSCQSFVVKPLFFPLSNDRCDGRAEGAEAAAECWRESLSFSDSPSSEQTTPSWSTCRSTIWAKSVIARSSGNVTRGSTVAAFCCHKVGGCTNARNSVVSGRRDFNSVDKSCTDSVKDCKTSGFGEAVAPTSSVCFRSSTALRSCSVSLWTGPVQFFPGWPKSWADFNSLQPGHLLGRPIGMKWKTTWNSTVQNFGIRSR